MKATISTNVAKTLSVIRGLPRRVVRLADKGLARTSVEVSRDMRIGAPKADSVLTNSIHHEKHGELNYHVIAGARHALAVEKGTREGGVPPLQSMIDWIRVKRIEPHDPNMDEEDLAFLIMNSIAKKGTPAQPFAEPALKTHLPRLRQRLQDAVISGIQA